MLFINRQVNIIFRPVSCANKESHVTIGRLGLLLQCWHSILAKPQIGAFCTMCTVQCVLCIIIWHQPIKIVWRPPWYYELMRRRQIILSGGSPENFNRWPSDNFTWLPQKYKSPLIPMSFSKRFITCFAMLPRSQTPTNWHTAAPLIFKLLTNSHFSRRTSRFFPCHQLSACLCTGRADHPWIGQNRR